MLVFAYLFASIEGTPPPRNGHDRQLQNCIITYLAPESICAASRLSGKSALPRAVHRRHSLYLSIFAFLERGFANLEVSGATARVCLCSLKSPDSDTKLSVRRALMASCDLQVWRKKLPQRTPY